MSMYNWSTDTKILKKDKEAYKIWRLEQLINFGLKGEKISTKELKKYWKKLRIDLNRKKVLSLWLA